MQRKPDWISVPDAAQLMGCSDVWVIKLLKNKTLDGFKLSDRAWCVSRTSAEKNVKEYLERDPRLSGRKRSGLD